MKNTKRPTPAWSGQVAALFACLWWASVASFATAAEPAAVESPVAVTATGLETSPALERMLNGSAPDSLADLRMLEERVQELARRVVPCTVGVRIGAAQGSGVIITADGYVLTAAHVAGNKPGQTVTFILPDGSTVRGKTLGVNVGIDAGLMKIDDQYKKPPAKSADSKQEKQEDKASQKKSEEDADNDSSDEPNQKKSGDDKPGKEKADKDKEDSDESSSDKPDEAKEKETKKPTEPRGEKILWPFVEMGKSSQLKPGQWVVATGHPGGYEKGRRPVLRVGRVLRSSRGAITTDCTLVGGDSGGPLFDGYGKVIGIHSRIGDTLATNIHVPVDTFRDTWDRLADGEVFGQRNFRGPYIGVTGSPDAENARIEMVLPDSPAAKAGLKPGDVILKLDGKEIKTFENLSATVRGMKPGTKVKLEVQRDEETLTIELTIGRLG